MKRASKVLAILMALALVMGFAAMSASAVYGGTTNFQKHLVLDDDAQVPNVAFAYTLTPGTGVPGTASTITINDGIAGATVESAVFSNSMTANTTAGRPDDNGTTTSGKVYATDTVTMDFSAVDFPQPGIYRYELREQPTTGYYGSITNDEHPLRYVDVIVAYDTNDIDNDQDTTELLVQSYAMRNPNDEISDIPSSSTDPSYAGGQVPDVKLVSYTNEYETADLTFSKTITGNQADTTKRFVFTLELENVIPGTYELSFSGDEDAIVGENNPNVGSNGTNYTITIPDTGDNAGTYTGNFYLTNNDSVTVVGLNTGFNYEVSENPEDYTKTDDGDTTGTDVQADATEAFTNDRSGVIPTGVIITVAPFLIGLLLFGAVMMFMISRRRRAAY